MNDYMWTTEEDNDNEIRAQLREQIDLLSRQMEQRDLERARQERERNRTAAEAWGRQADRVRDRVLRAEWPEPSNETLGFLQDFLDGKMPKEKKEDKILKPLPDELFEID